MRFFTGSFALAMLFALRSSAAIFSSSRLMILCFARLSRSRRFSSSATNAAGITSASARYRSKRISMFVNICMVDMDGSGANPARAYTSAVFSSSRSNETSEPGAGATFDRGPDFFLLRVLAPPLRSASALASSRSICASSCSTCVLSDAFSASILARTSHSLFFKSSKMSSVSCAF